MKSHGFEVQYGDLPNCFDFGSKTRESYPFKGPYFQKNSRGKKWKKIFKKIWKNVFFNAYIIVEDNKILIKMFFDTFFYFLKRVYFQQQKSYVQLS